MRGSLNDAPHGCLPVATWGHKDFGCCPAGGLQGGDVGGGEGLLGKVGFLGEEGLLGRAFFLGDEIAEHSHLSGGRGVLG